MVEAFVERARGFHSPTSGAPSLVLGWVLL